MLHQAGEPGFAQELRRGGGGRSVGDQLDRDPPAQQGVFRLAHDPRPAPAEPAEQPAEVDSTIWSARSLRCRYTDGRAFDLMPLPIYLREELFSVLAEAIKESIDRCIHHSPHSQPPADI